MITKVEVATKVIILNQKNEVLLLVRSETDPHVPGTYDFPGGKLTLWETPLDGAKRETLEETGIALCELVPIRTWSFEKGEVYIIGITFFARYQGIPKVVLSYEHSQYIWLKKEQISLYNIPEAMKVTLWLLFDDKLGKVEFF